LQLKGIPWDIHRLLQNVSFNLKQKAVTMYVLTSLNDANPGNNCDEKGLPPREKHDGLDTQEL
jgi:hypothetical protein